MLVNFISTSKTVAEKSVSFDWSTLLSAAMIAAVISAIVSIIGQWLGRQNAKLSAQIARENAILNANLEVATTLTRSRQDWINRLREDMAQLAGAFALRSRAIAAGEAQSDETFAKMIALASRIRMRLNPDDEDYDKLIKLMSDASLKKTASQIGAATHSFIRVSQDILKREWEVLKADLRHIQSIDDLGIAGA